MEKLETGVRPVLLAAVALYFTLSLVLKRSPELLHRARRNRARFFDFTHIAHRGCRLEGIPENTLAAFQHAMEASADVLEFDVWLTRDGQVVVFHDSDLERMTGVKGHIGDFAYDGLPRIRVVPEEHWAVTDANREAANKIPLLSEVLEVLPPQQRVIIEFKQGSNELIDQVHSMLSAQGRKERVIWFSLQDHINTALRRRDRSIPNITSVTAMLKVLLLYYVGLFPFCSFEEDIFGVPVDEVNYARVRGAATFRQMPDSVCYLLASVLGGKPPRPLIPSGLFEHLRKRGIPVFFLGVNDEIDIKVAVKAGATAVLTDRPRWLTDKISQGAVVLKRLPAY